MKNDNIIRLVFTGGGTGGHIYPGLAVADDTLALFKSKNIDVEIYWIGSSAGMDRSIVEKHLVKDGGSITKFYGIPSGKLRRYFSLQNFVDLFKIAAGYFKAIHLIRKLKPACVFSKGGFVSVPPCRASKLLKVPYFTHECDFTPGLATRLNSGAAKNVFVSYEQTKDFFKDASKDKCIVTGNPVRPVFYENSGDKGLEFLGIDKNHSKKILLVLGGSLGALQINKLVVENLQWLKERFIVVHQTGKAFADDNADLMNSGDDSYKPYAFIYNEMPSVVQCADVILSRSGANSIWEAAVCAKPMVLVPLCGSGTRGDQVDNARFFEKNGCAFVLAGEEATSENLRSKLEEILKDDVYENMKGSLAKLTSGERPSYKIASLVEAAVSKEK